MKNLSFKEEKIENLSFEDPLFEYIENINGGINVGELVTICTKFGCGQTSLAIMMALCFIKAVNTTLYISTEETESQIAKRTKDIIKKYEWDENDINLDDFFFESEKLDIASIEQDIKKANPQFVIIDNLQGLVGSKSKNGALLKKLAVKYKCAIFVMSQVNKLKDPIMTDVATLSKSDTLLNESDQIWITTNTGMKGEDDVDFVIVNIVKNRKGGIGKTWLALGNGVYFSVEEEYLKEQIDMDYIDYINDHYPRWYDKITDLLESIDCAASRTVTTGSDDNRPIRVMKNGLII